MQDEIFSPASIPGTLSLDRCTFLLYSPRLSLWSADNAEYRENERRIERMATLTENVLKNELDRFSAGAFVAALFKALSHNG